MKIHEELIDGAFGDKIHLTSFTPDTIKRVVILARAFDS